MTATTVLRLAFYSRSWIRLKWLRFSWLSNRQLLLITNQLGIGKRIHPQKSPEDDKGQLIKVIFWICGPSERWHFWEDKDTNSQVPSRVIAIGGLNNLLSGPPLLSHRRPDAVLGRTMQFSSSPCMWLIWILDPNTCSLVQIIKSRSSDPKF